MNYQTEIEVKQVPDNTGLTAKGWVIVTIGTQDYWLPAWQEGDR